MIGTLLNILQSQVKFWEISTKTHDQWVHQISKPGTSTTCRECHTQTLTLIQLHFHGDSKLKSIEIQFPMFLLNAMTMTRKEGATPYLMLPLLVSQYWNQGETITLRGNIYSSFSLKTVCVWLTLMEAPNILEQIVLIHCQHDVDNVDIGMLSIESLITLSNKKGFHWL